MGFHYFSSTISALRGHPPPSLPVLGRQQIDPQRPILAVRRPTKVSETSRHEAPLPTRRGWQPRCTALHESTDTTTTFRFAARPGVRDWVLDLVRRESACCPFLSYEVDQEDEQIVWATSGGLSAPDMAILDEFLAGEVPSADSASTIAEHLEDRGGIPVIVPATESDR
jgi:hypothetical protein